MSKALIIPAAIFCLGVPGLRAQAVKIDQARVERTAAQVGKMAEAALVRTGVPGMAIAVVYKDKVISAEGFGYRKAGETARVDADTVFQIASLSKPITATVLGAMISQGHLSWDDPISSLDPNFKWGDPWVTDRITVRDLLSHHSGLPDHAGDFLEDLGYDRTEVLSRLRVLDISDKFRAQYKYTNFGFTQAAEAAAISYGQSWENVARRFLYDPLGMTWTSGRHDDYVRAGNRAWLHVPVNGVMVAKYDRNPDAQSPAGGVSSTVNDLSKWLVMMLNRGMYGGKEIVKNAELGQAQSPQILVDFDPTNGAAQFYGLGWNVSYDQRGRRISHSGAFSRGAGTVIVFYPEEQVGIIALSNAAPVGLPEAMAQSFFEILHRDAPVDAPLSMDWIAFIGERFKEMETNPAVDYSELTPPLPNNPTLPIAAYTGTYHSDYFGDLVVTQTGNQLSMRLGRRQDTFPLSHWEKDVFTYVFDEESDSGTRGVLFGEVANGRPQTVVLDNFRNEAGGLFRRVATTTSPTSEMKSGRRRK